MKRVMIVFLMAGTAVGQWTPPVFLDSSAHGPCKFAQGPSGHEWVGYIDKRSDPPMLRIRHLPDSSYYDVDSVGVWSDDVALVMSAGLPHAFYVRRNPMNPASGTIFLAKFTGRQWLIEAIDSLHNEYGTLLAAHSSGDTLWVLYHQQWPVGGTFVTLIQASKVGSGPWTYDTVISSTSDHFEPIATIGSEVMFYHFVGQFKNHPTPEDHPLWSQNLCLARKEGHLWVVDTVNVGVDLVFAVYDATKWFAVFQDEGWWNLTLMKGNFGGWETIVLDTGKIISSPKIDVWQGRPYILSVEPKERAAAPPWFLTFRGANWPMGQVELVDSCEQVCSHGMSIRVLPDGRIAVVAALWRRNGRCDEVRYSVREALSIKEQEGNLVTRAGRAATIGRQFGRPAHDIKFFDVTGRLVRPTRPGIYHCLEKGEIPRRVVFIR